MGDEGKQTILIIEDDADLRRILQFQLCSEGFDVAEAEDGKAACQLILKQEYACILLDLMMPNMDGFNFLKRLRTASPTTDTPVIILTASHDKRNRKRSNQYFADAYMTKPYDLAELTQTIRNLCGEAAARTS